jgi:hypothetical protein
MHKQHEQLIHSFYQSFTIKDYRVMQSCYADNAVFNDEVFVDLNSSQVKAMWEMFCKNGKDLQIQFSNIITDENFGSVDWIATYTFSKSNRKVTNKIKANFLFENGKIIKHTDSFSFYNWSCQALGMLGILLGWTPNIKNKVKQQALKNLMSFMNNK